MNGMFFSTKMAAQGSKSGLLIDLFVNQIGGAIEVNGAGPEMLRVISQLHVTDIAEMNSKIEDILRKKVPITSLSKHSLERHQAVLEIIQSKSGFDFAKKVKPSLTKSEYKALCNHLNEIIKALKSELEQTKEKINRVPSPTADTISLSNSFTVESMEDINKRQKFDDEYERQRAKLSESLLKVVDLENKLRRLETEIRSIDEKLTEVKAETKTLEENNEGLEIEKKGLETAKNDFEDLKKSMERNRRIDEIVELLKINEKQLRINKKAKESLERDLGYKKNEVENYRKKEQQLREQIAALELKVICYHEKSLFLPWFSFLRKHFLLSPALQYQIAKFLVSEIRDQDVKALWKNNLFELLNQLDQFEDKKQVIGDWFQKNMPQLSYQIDSHQKLIHLSLKNEKLSPVIEKYFKDLP
jgi:CII-binding regulator of phage lambda lysogenization HflD